MTDAAGLRRAVFLDRDGCMNAMIPTTEGTGFDSPYHPDEFALLPGVAAAVAQVRGLGFLAVVISNQPGVAKGRCTPATLDAVTDRMHQQLAAGGTAVDGVYYCLHHPQGTVPELTGPCACRKPKPGLLLQAAADLGIDLAASYMIGDNLTDVAAGQAAGCQAVLAKAPGSPFKGFGQPTGISPDAEAADLPAAVDLIIRAERQALRLTQPATASR